MGLWHIDSPGGAVSVEKLINLIDAAACCLGTERELRAMARVGRAVLLCWFLGSS